jgi:hypothetical protein
VHEQFEVYALNVYVNCYNRKRKFLHPLQQWILDLVARKPQAIFVAVGNFNTSEQPIKHIYFAVEPGAFTFRRTIRGKIV